HNALIAASFGVQPFNVRAWMGKAGMRPEDRTAESRAVSYILGALPSEFVRCDAGLWDREAKARAKLVSGASAMLEQRGKSEALTVGAVLELDRLSALRTVEPVVLEHEWIGRIEAPPESLLFVFDLPGLLDSPAQTRV